MRLTESYLTWNIVEDVGNRENHFLSSYLHAIEPKLERVFALLQIRRRSVRRYHVTCRPRRAELLQRGEATSSLRCLSRLIRIYEVIVDVEVGIEKPVKRTACLWYVRVVWTYNLVPFIAPMAQVICCRSVTTNILSAALASDNWTLALDTLTSSKRIANICTA